MSSLPNAPTSAPQIICHCQRVTFAQVEAELQSGRARSLADIQQTTTACTRCFGCRFELERLLKHHLGDAYVRTASVTRTPSVAARGGPALPRRMYIPVLEGFRGYDVRTRLIMFNWADPEPGVEPEPVQVRADLLSPAGERLSIQEATLAPGSSIVLDAASVTHNGGLGEGLGVFKLVVDSSQLGSLRPYFHLVSSGGITSTHEKAGPKTPGAFKLRGSHWIFPFGYSPAGEEAYFFLTNTQEQPMDNCQLIWQSESGESRRIPLPALELDQSACVGIHDHVPEILTGKSAGSVRLDPAAHKVAGFMIRHDTKEDLWRIQHL